MVLASTRFGCLRACRVRCDRRRSLSVARRARHCPQQTLSLAVRDQVYVTSPADKRHLRYRMGKVIRQEDEEGGCLVYVEDKYRANPTSNERTH